MKYRVGYVGIDKASNKRIWGFMINDNDYREVYVFWGVKSSNLTFKRTSNDHTFFLNRSRKRRKYTIGDTSLADYTYGLFSQYMLVKKLKSNNE